ncbi:hypothetical protein [Phyllobacterium zundukense]|jgi:hypothetical protein|uniref:Uncharacterized protein n=1 Tax=Phyllobacterium zundukense TaxID=1867719 RepID=A0ACD4D2D1_9HYPH|nr:hypothetical protein [Phyllobacterium zundukense]UXN60011.1 hypothetical protein N8E88_26255 [Phyllobacterium zundukense]
MSNAVSGSFNTSKNLSKTRILLFIIPVVALAACASPEKKWVHSEEPVTPADKDMVQCKYQAAGSTAALAADTAARSKEEANLVNACMRAKGYKQ